MKGVRMTAIEALQSAKIEDITLKLVLTVGDHTYEGMIDNNELFMVDLMTAIRNGRDPADALAFLADEGSRRCPLHSVARQNRIGQPKTTPSTNSERYHKAWIGGDNYKKIDDDDDPSDLRD